MPYLESLGLEMEARFHSLVSFVDSLTGLLFLVSLKWLLIFFGGGVQQTSIIFYSVTETPKSALHLLASSLRVVPPHPVGAHKNSCSSPPF